MCPWSRSSIELLALVLDSKHDEIGLVNETGGAKKHSFGSAIETNNEQFYKTNKIY